MLNSSNSHSAKTNQHQQTHSILFEVVSNPWLTYPMIKVFPMDTMEPKIKFPRAIQFFHRYLQTANQVYWITIQITNNKIKQKYIHLKSLILQIINNRMLDQKVSVMARSDAPLLEQCIILVIIITYFQIITLLKNEYKILYSRSNNQGKAVMLLSQEILMRKRNSMMMKTNKYTLYLKLNLQLIKKGNRKIALTNNKDTRNTISQS